MKEKKKDFILSYRKNKIDKSEQMFEDYKSEHKRACNRIEKILSEQKKENRKLIVLILKLQNVIIWLFPWKEK